MHITFIRCLAVTVLFAEKHYFHPQPHPPCSSSSRHLREAIRTSPQPGLSESGLRLSWGRAKLPQSHRSEPARPSLPRDSLSLIEGIRTGQRARNWPGQRDILTHLPSTAPHRLLHPPSLLPLELQSFSPAALREEKDVTYHPFLTRPLLPLFLPLTPPLTKHTQTPLPPLFVVTWSWWTIFQIDFKNVHKQPIP